MTTWRWGLGLGLGRRRRRAWAAVALAVAVASTVGVGVECSALGVAFANASVTMLDASTGAASVVTNATHDAYAYYGFDLATVASDVDVVLDVAVWDAGTRDEATTTRRDG